MTFALVESLIWSRSEALQRKQTKRKFRTEVCVVFCFVHSILVSCWRFDDRVRTTNLKWRSEASANRFGRSRIFFDICFSRSFVKFRDFCIRREFDLKQRKQTSNKKRSLFSVLCPRFSLRYGFEGRVRTTNWSEETRQVYIHFWKKQVVLEIFSPFFLAFVESLTWSRGGGMWDRREVVKGWERCSCVEVAGARKDVECIGFCGGSSCRKEEERKQGRERSKHDHQSCICQTASFLGC